MSNEEFLELCEKYPQLTSEGFGVNMKYAEGRNKKEFFAFRREELKNKYPEFLLCLKWLDEHTIEGKWNAHYWKDRVHNDTQYKHWMLRGAFILAAFHHGLTVEQMDDTTDAWISVLEEPAEREE